MTPTALLEARTTTQSADDDLTTGAAAPGPAGRATVDSGAPDLPADATASGATDDPRSAAPAAPTTGQRVEEAAAQLAVILMIPVTLLCWLNLGTWFTWPPLVIAAVSVAAGLLVGFAIVFGTTFLLELRRGWRRMNAEAAARYRA